MSCERTRSVGQGPPIHAMRVFVSFKGMTGLQGVILRHNTSLVRTTSHHRKTACPLMEKIDSPPYGDPDF